MQIECGRAHHGGTRAARASDVRTPGHRPDAPEEEVGDSLALVREEAGVRTEIVEREARARVRVIEEPATIEVRRLREHFRVTREPLDRMPVGYRIRESRTLSVPVREEDVRIEKRSVLVEEVALRTRPVERTDALRTTLRREDLDEETSTR